MRRDRTISAIGADCPHAGSAGLKSPNANSATFVDYFRLSRRSPVQAVALMDSQQLLAMLAPGQALSGTAMATRAGVTRAAVWKQIEVLRARGVPIEASTAAGYKLPWPLQMLDEASIRASLPASLSAALGALEVHWELDSTSSELQRRVSQAADFSMLLAETQTAGRGRRGRPWLSPPGLNLYLSCLKRFENGFVSLAGLSLAIGVMVLRAMGNLAITGAGLKWPNDLLAVNGSSAGGKLGGILVELTGEYQGPCVAIIGIGLNLRLTDLLREQAGQPISDLATLAGGTPADRNHVAASLIGALIEGLRQFEQEGFAGFAADFARHDLLYGERLHLAGACGEFDGTGAGVDSRGALLVHADDGELHRIDSADVTVRPA